MTLLKNKSKKHCAIATVSPNGKPECAIVGYSVYDDLSLLLYTDNKSRKWHNLQVNNTIAVAIGWDANEAFIQYEGLATFITGGDLYRVSEDLFFTDHHNSLQFKGQAGSVFIKVKPLWARLTDLTKDPPRIEEVSL